MLAQVEDSLLRAPLAVVYFVVGDAHPLRAQVLDAPARREGGDHCRSRKPVPKTCTASARAAAYSFTASTFVRSSSGIDGSEPAEMQDATYFRSARRLGAFCEGW
eukprot:1156027-Prymnesium_polylepis.1